MRPVLSSLILTHMLPTELRSKANSFQKWWQKEPPLQDGCAIPEAHHACVKGDPPRRATSLQKVPTVIVAGACPDRWATTESLTGSITSCAGRVFLGSRGGTDLQQPHRKRGQQPQQADQALHTLHLSLLDATATFEAVVRVFDQPP